MNKEAHWARGTLVLVANGTRARLCRVHGGQADVVRRMQNELGRQRERDLVTDRPGRYQAAGQIEGRRGLNPRSALEPMSVARVAAFEAYARTLAQEVAAARATWKDHAIALVAPPQLLGYVRAHLGDEEAARVVASLSPDYTSLPNARLLDMLERAGVPGAKALTEA